MINNLTEDFQHWGPKRQHFYEFAANMTSSKDVYSRKRIIAVTRSSIMKKYDYGHLEEIKVRREDQNFTSYREGYFPQLLRPTRCIRRHVTSTCSKEAGQSHNQRMVCLECGIMYVHQTDYHSNVGGRSSIRCQKLPKEAQPYQARHIQVRAYSDYVSDSTLMILIREYGIRKISLKRKWSGLDKRRAWVMIQDIDKQLYERRLMRNLEKFVGGREYENDLRLLERII
ncbi:hypothetical protein Tco_0662701 [Tanacetum coccineum]